METLTHTHAYTRTHTRPYIHTRAQLVPHLVNLNADPFMSECLMYFIEPGDTNIGRKDAEIEQDIILDGLNILKHHCIVVRL